MRLDHAFVIGKREYLTRVKTKGFWIATVAMPLIMAALLVGPTFLMNKIESRQRIALVDASGEGLGPQLAAALADEQKGAPVRSSAAAAKSSSESLRQAREARRERGAVRFEPQLVTPRPDAAAQRRELDDMVRAKKIDAWVWLTPQALAKNSFEYHAESVSNFETQRALADAVSRVVREARLRQAGYDAAKVEQLSAALEAETVRVSEKGSRAEGGLGNLILAGGLFFMLYFVLVIYGQQVLTGVVEEKSSRVIEVVSSAVKPTELMLGKLGGICLVALTQLAIWVAAAALLTTPGVIASTAISAGTLPTLSPVVIAHFFVLFLLGFTLFSTVYLMIGAAFNSVQEAQQVAGFVIVLVVAPVLFVTPVLNDPDSSLAVGLSLFPFFTPLVMTARIATKMPPAWQIATAYTLCVVTIGLMIWLCSRIYRVGILMYGKKPTVQEIWRWVRYT